MRIINFKELAIHSQRKHCNTQGVLQHRVMGNQMSRPPGALTGMQADHRDMDN